MSLYLILANTIYVSITGLYSLTHIIVSILHFFLDSSNAHVEFFGPKSQEKGWVELSPANGKDAISGTYRYIIHLSISLPIPPSRVHFYIIEQFWLDSFDRELTSLSYPFPVFLASPQIDSDVQTIVSKMNQYSLRGRTLQVVKRRDRPFSYNNNNNNRYNNNNSNSLATQGTTPDEDVYTPVTGAPALIIVDVQKGFDQVDHWGGHRYVLNEL